MLTLIYTTFFFNEETQILFLDSDDLPSIPYHKQELTNIGLLSTLHWLNTNNLKYKQICITLCAVLCFGVSRNL